MQITEIKKIGKGKRYSLKVDDKFEGVFEADILARYNLKTGQELQENFLQTLKLENGNFACFDRALSLLEHGMKTKKQVFDYLKNKAYPEDCIESAVKKLEDYGYINDLAYANEYIKLNIKKSGMIKIKFDLKTKGIPEDVLQQSLQNFIDKDTEIESCFDIATKKMKGQSLDLKGKQKLYSYLASRGFSFDVINSALSKMEEK